MKTSQISRRYFGLILFSLFMITGPITASGATWTGSGPITIVPMPAAFWVLVSSIGLIGMLGASTRGRKQSTSPKAL